jgi:hypothetical protein
MNPLMQKLLLDAAADELSDVDIWRAVEKFSGSNDRNVACDVVSALVEAGFLRIHLLGGRKVPPDEPIGRLLQELRNMWAGLPEEETIFSTWFVLTDEGRRQISV